MLCANGMKTVIDELAPRFEQATGHKVVTIFDTGGATIKRARSGEPADVVIGVREGIEGLVKDGRTVAGTAAPIASTGISVAVRKGTPRPDISSPDAFRRSLLAAKSITYLNPADGGASGIYFAGILERLGIANEMKVKTVLAPSVSALGRMVANGEAELGVLQFQLLYSLPGLDIAGPLPGDLQNTTVFSAAILSSSESAELSKTLIELLRGPAAAEVIKAKGMEPAR